MGFNAKAVPQIRKYDKKREDYLDTGSYPARLVALTILGIQKQDEFKGERKPDSLEIQLTYELLDEFLVNKETGEIDETKPKWISEIIPFRNLNADRATSTKRYYVLDPNDDFDGDWTKLLGLPCKVNIVLESWKNKQDNTDRFKNKIDSISAMRPKEATNAPELVNPTRVFDFYNPDMEVWPKIPAWLQDYMKEAVDFPGSPLDYALRSYTPPAEANTTAPATPATEKKTRAPKAPLKVADEVAKDDDEDW